MARMARGELFDPSEVAIVHVMNRVERRCFLFGDDPITGKNFGHLGGRFTGQANGNAISVRFRGQR